MVRCAYCTKHSSHERTNHSFPLSDPTLLEKWLKNMNVVDGWSPTVNSRLCSDHFLANCYQTAAGSSRRILRKGSIPTVFAETRKKCTYCNVSRSEGQVKRTFHKFPLSCPKTLEKWLRNMPIKDWYPTEESRLCSDHFEPSSFFIAQGYLKLRDGSIPSIFATESTIGDAASIGQRPPETSSVTAVIELDERSLQQPMTTDQTELAVDIVSDAIDADVEPTIGGSESLVTCPQCNHTFDAEGLSANLKRRSSFNQSCSKKLRTDGQMDQGEISVSAVEIGLDTPRKESEPAAMCSRSELESPNVDEKRNLTVHDHNYETSPRSTKRKLQSSRESNKKLRRGLRMEQKRCNRLKKKVTSLQEVVGELRRNRTLPENSLNCSDTIAESDVSELMKRFLKNASGKSIGQVESKIKKRPCKSQRNKCEAEDKGPSREKYPPALRVFALTLHFYSPKAYAFVRAKFCKALPEPSTLRAWYSAVDGEPGFTSESFEALKVKVAENKQQNKRVLCSLMIDEVGIAKGINRAPNGKVRGYIDLGTDIESSDSLGLAKEALVIMAVAADSNWKLPIGYFLIDGITADVSSNILSQAITRLHDAGVEVMSVTLDGPPTHFALLSLLGATFQMPSTQPFFPHPVTRDPVYVVFDACHMLKLFRNCLGDLKTIKDGEGRYIEWKYITSLAFFQQAEGLRAGNKLRLAHINYFKMKMKVRLAAQTLSSSVADSSEHCDKVLKLPEFRGCEGTVRFIRCIDRLFDLMNSRNPFGKGFKAPLRRNNEHIWRGEISKELEYLAQLRDLAGTLMISTRRYVAFVGMFTAVQSVMAIYDTYVKPVDAPLKYLLAYKLSQDHLELFFCAIRCCGGWSPNPSAAHFVSAYKRLLIQHQVRGVNGNVSELDSTKILHVPSTIRKTARVDRYDPGVYDEMANQRVLKKYDLEVNDESDGDIMTDFLKFKWTLPENLSDFSRNSISYIAGFVVRKAWKVIKCEYCRVACVQDRSTIHNIKRDIYLARLHSCMQDSPKQGEKDISLVKQKNRGGLIIPSDSVLDICQICEKLFRHALNANRGHPPREPNFLAVLCSQVMHELFQKSSSLFPALDDHNFDEDAEDLSSHVFRLTKEIIKGYIEERMLAATDLATEAAIGVKIRHHLSRQIIWQSQ